MPRKTQKIRLACFFIVLAVLTNSRFAKLATAQGTTIGPVDGPVRGVPESYSVAQGIDSAGDPLGLGVNAEGWSEYCPQSNEPGMLSFPSTGSRWYIAMASSLLSVGVGEHRELRATFREWRHVGAGGFFCMANALALADTTRDDGTGNGGGGGALPGSVIVTPASPQPYVLQYPVTVASGIDSVVGANDGNIVAFDEAGQVLWSVDVGPAVATRGTWNLQRDRIAFGTTDGRLVSAGEALIAGSHIDWQANLGSSLLDPIVTTAGDRVIAVTAAGNAFVVRAPGGVVEHQVALGGQPALGVTLLEDGETVYVPLQT